MSRLNGTVYPDLLGSAVLICVPDTREKTFMSDAISMTLLSQFLYRLTRMYMYYLLMVRSKNSIISVEMFKASALVGTHYALVGSRVWFFVFHDSVIFGTVRSFGNWYGNQ